MSAEKPYTFVLGCGEKGAAWAAGRPRVICLDLQRWKLTVENSIQGSVFYLPIASGIAEVIHADFIINGLINREITAPQILQNPDVLVTNYFPPLVNRWYSEIAAWSHEYVRRNIQEVAKLMQTTALREMVRVLAPNGRLEIVDFKKNLDWIKKFPYYIFQRDSDRLKITDQELCDDDFARSASLEKFIRVDPAQKIEITKLKLPVTKTFNR